MTGPLKPSEPIRDRRYAAKGVKCETPIVLPSLPPELPGPYRDQNSPNSSNQSLDIAPAKPTASPTSDPFPVTLSPNTVLSFPAPSTSLPISKYVRSRPKSSSSVLQPAPALPSSPLNIPANETNSSQREQDGQSPGRKPTTLPTEALESLSLA